VERQLHGEREHEALDQAPVPGLLPYRLHHAVDESDRRPGRLDPGEQRDGAPEPIELARALDTARQVGGDGGALG
jgi:hypothetical protein